MRRLWIIELSSGGKWNGIMVSADDILEAIQIVHENFPLEDEPVGNLNLGFQEYQVMQELPRGIVATRFRGHGIEDE